MFPTKSIPRTILASNEHETSHKFKFKETEIVHHVNMKRIMLILEIIEIKEYSFAFNFKSDLEVFSNNSDCVTKSLGQLFNRYLRTQN